MEFLFVFIFAHLVGDFILQTNNVAEMKERGKAGLIVHTGIIILIQTTFLSIFGIEGMILGLVAGLAHFIIDYMKIILKRHNRKLEFFYFILDQAIHFMIIIFLSYIFIIFDFDKGKSNIADTYIIYIKIGIAFIVCTFVGTVAIKILLRDLYVYISKDVFFQKYERTIDASLSIILTFAWAMPFLYRILLFIGILFLYCKVESILYRYDSKISLTKFIFFIVLSLGIINFI